MPAPLFVVLRPHPDASCADGPCDCLEPQALVDVDELTRGELAHYWVHGTAEQQAAIVHHLEGDPELERLAGQRDPIPELARVEPLVDAGAGAANDGGEGRRCA